MFASAQEALEEWRSRTLSPAEYSDKLYDEWLDELQRSEIEAENAYVTMMESGSHYLGEPDWAM